MSQYTSPVIAGHRGFKAKYTENTLEGFNKCYDSGATVIETDLWKTFDDVLVISHDANTKRIFCHENGATADYHIPSTKFKYLKDLVTIESSERLLTFRDLLRWFVSYVDETGSNSHKLMLDIKKENPVKITKLIVQELLAVNGNISWWLHRIQFGIWSLNILKYLNQDPFFQKIFKNSDDNEFGYRHFDIIHISVNWRDSVHYINYNFYVDNLPKDGHFRFKLTAVSLIYISTWSVGFLTKFIPLLKLQDLKLYSWTINSKAQYEYLDHIGKAANLREFGVITDIPDFMVDVKNGINSNTDEPSEITQLTSSEDFSDNDGSVVVHLSVKQKVVYSLLKFIQSTLGPNRITDDEKRFNSYVNENAVQKVHINLVYGWVFRTCQAYGIF